MVAEAFSQHDAFFKTRGVVIAPADLSLADWPERAARAGLNTIALHPSPRAIASFVDSQEGAAFLQRCAELGLHVEYELHAMSELLPRDLFGREPACFRMNGKGIRVADNNVCASSTTAVEVMAEHAVKLAGILRPTTGRHFLWGDDGGRWCKCPKCRGLSPSEQALSLENRLVEALREIDPDAQVAHLAYRNTLKPPKRVAPAPGVFLEFAPIQRRQDLPLAEGVAENRRDLELLDANLEVFPAETAQVLEYWLDASRFSEWRRPAVRIPWSSEVFATDLDTYGGRGIQNVTTFACYVDAEYVTRHGEPPLDQYGRRLRTWRSKSE